VSGHGILRAQRQLLGAVLLIHVRVRKVGRHRLRSARLQSVDLGRTVGTGPHRSFHGFDDLPVRELSAKDDLSKRRPSNCSQVGEGSDLHRELVEWFKSLPPMLDLGGIRVVHAWWHQPHVDLVASRLPSGRVIDEYFLHAAYVKGSPEWGAMEGLTKGLEVRLPVGYSFVDHSNVERGEVRTKWWHEAPKSYRDVAIVGDAQHHCVPDHPLPDDYAGAPVTGTPVFIGHYWMSGIPELQSPRVACVDYSAAKDGPLVAYRWDGEVELDAANFVEAGRTRNQLENKMPYVVLVDDNYHHMDSCYRGRGGEFATAEEAVAR